MLHDAVGGGGGFKCPEKGATKVYSPTLLTLQGDGWVSNFKEKIITQRLNGPILINKEYMLMFYSTDIRYIAVVWGVETG